MTWILTLNMENPVEEKMIRKKKDRMRFRNDRTSKQYLPLRLGLTSYSHHGYRLHVVKHHTLHVIKHNTTQRDTSSRSHKTRLKSWQNMPFKSKHQSIDLVQTSTIDKCINV